MSDKASLSPIGRRIMRSDEDVTAGIVRLVRSLGRRCAEGDPDSAVYLNMIRDQLDESYAQAVSGWRRNFSDSQIGHELGVTKQAVQQRWPRSS